MDKLPRSWVAVKSNTKSLSASHSPPQPPPGIKVLQWNVLADGLAQNGNFIQVSTSLHSLTLVHKERRRCQVPSSLLEWDSRWPLILKEIQEADADLVCLQEVNKYGKSDA